MKQKNGLSAAVYTQTTDVEGEINGLMTYDRKVTKIPEEKPKELHTQTISRIILTNEYQKKLIFSNTLLSFIYCEQTKKQKFVLEISSFQTEIEGKKTDLYQLKNEKIEVYITNYGARIVSSFTQQIRKNGRCCIGI